MTFVSYFSKRKIKYDKYDQTHILYYKTDPDTKMQHVLCRREDELTKNHRENDNEHISGFMPGAPGHCLYPATSFKKLFDKLDLRCDRLWQNPRKIVKDDSEWLCNASMGKNT